MSISQNPIFLQRKKITHSNAENLTVVSSILFFYLASGNRISGNTSFKIATYLSSFHLMARCFSYQIILHSHLCQTKERVYHSITLTQQVTRTQACNLRTLWAFLGCFEDSICSYAHCYVTNHSKSTLKRYKDLWNKWESEQVNCLKYYFD
jgi:hypothetical protein